MISVKMGPTKIVQGLFDKAGLPVIAKFSAGDESCDAEISLDGNFVGEETSYSIQFYEYGGGFGANFYSGIGGDWGCQTLASTKTVEAAANVIIEHILENKTLAIKS